MFLPPWRYLCPCKFDMMGYRILSTIIHPIYQSNTLFKWEYIKFACINHISAKVWTFFSNKSSFSSPDFVQKKTTYHFLFCHPEGIFDMMDHTMLSTIIHPIYQSNTLQMGIYIKFACINHISAKVWPFLFQTRYNFKAFILCFKTKYHFCFCQPEGIFGTTGHKCYPSQYCVNPWSLQLIFHSQELHPCCHDLLVWTTNFQVYFKCILIQFEPFRDVF